jgi:hypothetical protein
VSRARHLLATTAGAALAALAVAAPAWAGQWYAGDLHVHTTYSHDSYGGPTDDNTTDPQDYYTLGFPVLGDFALAASRGLDYLAITDHNDVRSQSDPGFGAFGVLGVPGYENSLHGHAQMLGATHLFGAVDAGSAAAVQGLADALRAQGGVFQVNHPANSTTDDPDDLDWALGYAVQPDTVEAWNSERVYQPPLPAANSHDDAVRYWQGWLDRGAHVALTGGSDSHWVSTSAAQGPGQPTTWIYAADRTVPALLDGLRHGRTTVSAQPPRYAGQRLFLEADADGDGAYESMVGDTVPAGARLRVRAENAAGMLLTVVGTHGRQLFKPVLVTSPSFTYAFRAPRGATWAYADLGQRDLQWQRQQHCPQRVLHAYCRNRILVFAMTSALYLTP